MVWPALQHRSSLGGVPTGRPVTGYDVKLVAVNDLMIPNFPMRCIANTNLISLRFSVPFLSD